MTRTPAAIRWNPDDLVPCSCALCGSSHVQGKLPRGDGLHVALCGCGLGYLSPRPRPEVIHRLYQTGYFDGGTDGIGYRDYLSRLHAMVQDPESLPRRLAALVQRESGLVHKRILDIGCGGGAFLAAARDLGAEVHGVEPSAEAAELGRTALGLDIQTGYLEQCEAAQQTFAVVTLFEVIEHPTDPLALAAQLRGVVQPGGHLWVSTPNFGLARFQGPRYHGLHCSYEHLYYWNARTLGRLLRLAGFEPPRFFGFNRRFVAGRPGEPWPRRTLRRLVRPLAERLPLDLSAATLVAVAQRR